MKKHFDIEGKKEFRFDPSKAVSQTDGSMIIEGFVSTPDLDDGMDIVEPAAFTPQVIAKYMEKPRVLFMHNYYDLPIGKTLDLRVRTGKGLWASILLLPTESQGRDVIMLIKEKALESFSYTYRVKEYTINEELGQRVIHEFKSISEISVVNLGMNFWATFAEQGKSLQFESKEMKQLMHDALGDKYKSIRVQKGNNKLEEEEKKALEKQAQEAKTAADTATVKVGEVQKTVDELAKLTKTMQEAQATSLKTQSETKTFVEKFATDFKAAVDGQTAAINKVQESRTTYGVANDCPFDFKSLMKKPTQRLKRLFSENKFAQIDELRQYNDHVITEDAFKAAADPSGYGRMDQNERMKTLNTYKELQLMAKAGFDTQTSNEGAEYLATGYSERMHELVHQNLVIASAHPTFPMIAATQVDNVEGADTMATRATEKTALINSFDATSQTPGSANKTFAAEKLRGRTQFSAESDEDLTIATLDYIEGKVSKSIARAWDYADLSGDNAGGTGLDSGDVPNAADPRYCWDGLRVMTQSGNKVDLSTWSEANLNLLRSKCGKYATGLQAWYWLTSIEAYLIHFLNKDETPSVRTIDQYGPQATVVTGELAKFDGSPILSSEFVLNTYDATGIYSAAGNTRSIVQVVNRMAFKTGIWRNLAIEIIRDGINDVYDVVGWWRGDFQAIYDETVENLTGTGFGVTTE